MVETMPRPGNGGEICSVGATGTEGVLIVIPDSDTEAAIQRFLSVIGEPYKLRGSISSPDGLAARIAPTAILTWR